jgi:uncharacterized protein
MAEVNGTNGTPRVGSASAADAIFGAVRTFAALHDRAQLAQRLGQLFDGRRHMHQLLGYKAQLQYRDLKARYLRQHIAQTIVRIFPEATWAQPPTVKEDNDTDTDTPFEQEWKALEERLHIFALLERTDVLANLGEYACLLIGLKGQADLSRPARPVSSPDDIIYLTPYSEEYAQVVELEQDAGLPTFGKPLYYTFYFGRGSTLAQTGPTVPSLHGRVHASRVLHVTDNLLDDEVYGIPRMLPVYDLLDDLYKVAGGSAEIFWRAALQRLVFALREQYKMAPEDEAALAQEVEEFVHELRQYVRVQGMDVTAIHGDVASPKENIEMILMLIASYLRVPQRILAGTEAGHLASTQDEAALLQRVQRRQIVIGERRMLRPLIDTFLDLRALTRPRKSYIIEWQNLLSLSEEQQGAVVKDLATAMAQANAAMDFRAVTALSRTLVEALGYDPEDPLLAPPVDPALLGLVSVGGGDGTVPPGGVGTGAVPINEL